MKRYPFILCIITFSMILGACEVVNVNSADELLHCTWYVENENSMKARLSFETKTDTARFIITDQNNTTTEIHGVFAVDKDNLYITSSSQKNTYVFGYNVYKDRLILSYNNTTLTFKADKEKEP
ncbi:MAG: hypothetical protein IKK10_05325 [Clostridia bacterium]|nr:hypothetical protein [Clostridia bacterium]